MTDATSLAGATLDEIESAITESLTRMAAQGSVPAANAALKLVESRRQASASDAHRARLEELSGDSLALAHYIGELGERFDTLEAMIGHELTTEELDALEDGARERRAEVRAIELSRARKGGSIDKWMQS